MSIDAFLQDLFPAAAPASFDDRFAALGQPYEDPSLPPNATLTSGTLPTGGDVPLPRPRPPVEALLAGPQPRPPGGPMGDAVPPQPAAPAGGGNDIMSRLAGLRPAGFLQPDNVATADDSSNGLMGRLMGFDSGGEKRLRSALANGFAGGNPAFAGGALMKGVSGGLTGGLKSDKEDTEAETAADAAKLKQANFNRTQSDKELTSDALRKLYGQRGDALVQGAVNRANNPAAGRQAWNKPASQRLQEVEKLILEKDKQLRGSVNPLLPKADRDAATANNATELDAFRKRLYRANGFDDNGNEVQAPSGGGAPATPSTPRTMGDKEATDSGLYDNQAISGAREAIARGANKAQVMQRLRDNGIKFDESDLAL